jgi:transposase
VSEEGFPFAFEVLEGNRRDVTTLEEMLDAVEHKYGYARRIWVFDRGVVSEKNLKLLRRRRTPYVVGTNRSELKQFEKELTSKNWLKVKEEVEIYKTPRVRGEELYVLVRSQGRLEKEKAIRERAMKSVEKRLQGLSQQVAKGRRKDQKKILLDAGAILGRYPSVARLYTLELKKEVRGRLTFRWSVKEDRLRWKKISDGTYLVRTNLNDMELDKLWEIYIQLTEAEAAFRAIKSELLIRPIWHHYERRVQAHILVAFLGYALWVTLKHSLKNSSFLHEYDYDVSPWNALSILSRIKSGDIILPTTDGRTLRLRRVSTPDRQGKLLLEKLKITLPAKLRLDESM